mgnify:CR=1 FL=1
MTKIDISTLSSLLACKANKHNFNKLWNSLDENYRVRIAENPLTPTDILRILSTDKVWYVRESVAKNPSATIDILKKLVNDLDFYVKARAARNPNLVNKL